MARGTSLRTTFGYHAFAALQPAPARSPTSDATLFLLPAIDDHEWTFSLLAHHLGNRCSVSLLQADLRFRPATPSASEAVALLRAAQPTGPYLLGGLGLSGANAFTAASILEQLGQQVRLVLFDTPLQLGTPAPIPSPHRPRAIAFRLARLFQPRLTTASSKVHFPILHFLPEQPGNSHSQSLGWERLTRADTDLAYLPGAHESLFAEANLPRIATVLTRWLASSSQPLRKQLH